VAYAAAGGAADAAGAEPVPDAVAGGVADAAEAEPVPDAVAGGAADASPAEDPLATCCASTGRDIIANARFKKAGMSILETLSAWKPYKRKGNFHYNSFPGPMRKGCPKETTSNAAVVTCKRYYELARTAGQLGISSQLVTAA
jgi:hypothetical protein